MSGKSSRGTAIVSPEPSFTWRAACPSGVLDGAAVVPPPLPNSRRRIVATPGTVTSLPERLIVKSDAQPYFSRNARMSACAPFADGSPTEPTACRTSST